MNKKKYADMTMLELLDKLNISLTEQQKISIAIYEELQNTKKSIIPFHATDPIARDPWIMPLGATTTTTYEGSVPTKKGVK